MLFPVIPLVFFIEIPPETGIFVQFGEKSFKM